MSTPIPDQLVIPPRNTDVEAWRARIEAKRAKLHRFAALNAAAVRAPAPRAARPATRARVTTPRAERAEDLKAIRAWATSSGIDCPSRGPLPRHVVDAYLTAHQDVTA